MDTFLSFSFKLLIGWQEIATCNKDISQAKN